MRLNKKHREAFVRAVLADVPTEEHRDRACRWTRTLFADSLPGSVRRVLGTSAEHHIQRDTIALPRPENAERGTYTQVPGHWTMKDADKVWENNPEQREAIRGELAAHHAQEERLRELRRELEVQINGCRTTNQAAKLMPELAGYLPSEDEEPTGNLPASHTLQKLTEAGWPKERKA